MLRSMEWVVKDLYTMLQRNPKDFIDGDHEEPSIDVRLCIDLDTAQPRYTIRRGLVSYDSYHSEFCAASYVTLDTDAVELLNELINQLEE